MDEKKRYYTYILKCADDTLYTGYTSDIDRRVSSHNKGHGSKYTRARLPVTLVYAEAHETKNEAMSREAKVKKLSRSEKLALITKKESELYPKQPIIK